MARLLLKDSIHPEQMGALVLKIAENTNGKIASLTTATKNQNTQNVAGLVKDPFNTKINLVYDDANTINIVIPYLDGAVYSGNKLAHEAMGSIVIMGCAS